MWVLSRGGGASTQYGKRFEAHPSQIEVRSATNVSAHLSRQAMWGSIWRLINGLVLPMHTRLHYIPWTNVSKQAEHIYNMIYIIYMPFHIWEFTFSYTIPQVTIRRVVSEQNQKAWVVVNLAERLNVQPVDTKFPVKDSHRKFHKTTLIQYVLNSWK